MARILLFVLLLQFSFSPLAIGQEYIVTDQQLTKLENKLIQLKSINSQLQCQLDLLHKQSQNQEKSLTNLSTDFDKFAASQHRKINELKLQRVLLVFGALAAVSIKR